MWLYATVAPMPACSETAIAPPMLMVLLLSSALTLTSPSALMVALPTVALVVFSKRLTLTVPSMATVCPLPPAAAMERFEPLFSAVTLTSFAFVTVTPSSTVASAVFF